MTTRRVFPWATRGGTRGNSTSLPSTWPTMLHGGIYEQNEAEEAGRFHPYVPPCRVSTFTFTRTAECVCVHARDIFVRKRINDAIIRSLPEARSLRRRRVACFRERVAASAVISKQISSPAPPRPRDRCSPPLPPPPVQSAEI